MPLCMQQSIFTLIYDEHLKVKEYSLIEYNLYKCFIRQGCFFVTVSSCHLYVLHHLVTIYMIYDLFIQVGYVGRPCARFHLVRTEVAAL